jgi:hypothetical protein
MPAGRIGRTNTSEVRVKGEAMAAGVLVRSGATKGDEIENYTGCVCFDQLW